ncbi:MAG TPA: hypothetical protein VF826_09580 [Chloroflexia bacterium]
MTAKDNKKTIFLDAQSIEELEVCRQHYRIGSQLAPISRVAQIVIHEAAEGPRLVPGVDHVTIRPLVGRTHTYHFVLGTEGQARLEELTEQYSPLVLKGEGKTPGDRTFRFTAAALLRYLIARKAAQVVSKSEGGNEPMLSSRPSRSGGANSAQADRANDLAPRTGTPRPEYRGPKMEVCDGTNN